VVNLRKDTPPEKNQIQRTTIRKTDDHDDVISSQRSGRNSKRTRRKNSVRKSKSSKKGWGGRIEEEKSPILEIDRALSLQILKAERMAMAEKLMQMN
jgi:hypothetical protein